MENPNEARTREYRDYIEQFLKEHLSGFRQNDLQISICVFRCI